MGDHQHRGTASSGGRQEVPDGGSEVGVQGGGRLVGDEDLRIAGESCGDRGALSHAAGQLVGKQIERGGIETDRPAQLGSIVRAVERRYHLVELRTNGAHGRERRRNRLRHQADAATTETRPSRATSDQLIIDHRLLADRQPPPRGCAGG